MTKSDASGCESNSVRKKKSKPDLPNVQKERTEEMNGKTKKKRKTDREKSDMCEFSQSITEENEQIPSADTTNTDKHKHKKKKRKNEESEMNTNTNVDSDETTRKKKKKSKISQDTQQIEDTTLTQEEDHTKKKKKKKHKDCEVIVPEADDETLQEAKHNTHVQTAEESTKKSKEKKREQRKTKVPGDVENTPVCSVEDEEDRPEGEEDLSPEERRVLERKLKKIRKKEEKKRMREEGKSTKQEKIKTSVAEKQALEYLTCWSERRDEWRFQKTRQTWLLQHMYDSVKVPDSSFEVLLCYLKGLCGAARETSRQKAEVFVRCEQQTEEDPVDAEKKKHRATLVLQTL